MIFVLDLSHFHKRDRKIKQLMGIPHNDNYLFKDIDIYTGYFNPSSGIMTGIKDNETNVFYQYNRQEDIIKFINVINAKEVRRSEFLKGIELSLKEFSNNEIRLYERIMELEHEVDKLEKQLHDVDDCLSNKGFDELRKMRRIGYE